MSVFSSSIIDIVPSFWQMLSNDMFQVFNMLVSNQSKTVYLTVVVMNQFPLIKSNMGCLTECTSFMERCFLMVHLLGEYLGSEVMIHDNALVFFHGIWDEVLTEDPI